jgi:transcriptional regulator with XRE-family HTH domain
MSSNLSSEAYVAFVDALVAIRQEQDISQQQLADRLGKLQSFISKNERRQRRIDVVEFIAIAEALGLDAPDLLRRIRRHLPGAIVV